MKYIFFIYLSILTLLLSCTDSTTKELENPDYGKKTQLTIEKVIPYTWLVSVNGTFHISEIKRSKCKVYYFCDMDSSLVAYTRTQFLNTENISNLLVIAYPTDDAHFSFNISSLKPYQDYHFFIAIVNDSNDNASFKSICSDLQSFKTKTSLSIQITNAKEISDNSVEMVCKIVRPGEFPIQTAGVCFGTEKSPTTESQKTVNVISKNSFSLILSNLNPEANYNIRPYATTEIGTVYGNTVAFPFKECHITFEPNGGIGDMYKQQYVSGMYQRLVKNNFVRNGYNFIGWSTSPTRKISYVNMANIVIEKDLILFAQWERDSNAIVCDANGYEYSVIKIGDQFWTKENWKSTRYADGELITEVTGEEKWGRIKHGAYFRYNNSVQESVDHGILYNWYAVGSGKLAPEGWRVPSDEDWQILEKHLIVNGYNYDGSTSVNRLAKSLAEINNPNLLWEHSDGNGAVGNINEYFWKNNSSGFSALPSGCRNEFGKYQYWGHHGYWWSLSDFDESYASNRIIGYYNYSLNKGRYHKRNGFSVRLVKDVTPSVSNP